MFFVRVLLCSSNKLRVSLQIFPLVRTFRTSHHLYSSFPHSARFRGRLVTHWQPSFCRVSKFCLVLLFWKICFGLSRLITCRESASLYFKLRQNFQVIFFLSVEPAICFGVLHSIVWLQLAIEIHLFDVWYLLILKFYKFRGKYMIMFVGLE